MTIVSLILSRITITVHMKVFHLNRHSKFYYQVTDKELLILREMIQLIFWIKFMTILMSKNLNLDSKPKKCIRSLILSISLENKRSLRSLSANKKYKILKNKKESSKRGRKNLRNSKKKKKIKNES